MYEGKQGAKRLIEVLSSAMCIKTTLYELASDVSMERVKAIRERQSRYARTAAWLEHLREEADV